MASMEQIQKLRSQTGAGVVDVKKALDETGGDYDKALDLLRKRGEAVALKKSARDASDGMMFSYIHMGRIGVLLELNCETDFVARTDDFQQLGKEICMQIASMSPRYVSSEEIPADVVSREREVYVSQIDASKPKEVQDKIIEGKLKKYYDEVCLLNQKFFKNEDQTIQALVTEAIGKIGENIRVRRFVRFSLDEHEQR
ncbi:MAG: elongation factor Ts [Candidatus Kerfeldbacteria bacterium]|nr:elongation factor Ts [Candidatus Kerfeldbacteria bacterium]